MNFQEINLHTNTETNIIIVNSQEIEVKKYLPISDKIDLIQIALQKSEEDGIYNDMKLDMYFHLNIIYLYTNIEFSIEDKEDEMKLYDILDSNDVITSVIGAMEEGEYEGLKESLLIMKEDNLTYKNTAAAVLTRIIQDLPKNAAAAKEIVDSFNPEQYQAVVDFATAANGGRNINTNQLIEQQTVPIKSAATSSPKKVVQIKQATKKD